MNYGALLKRMAAHVEVFKQFAAQAPATRRASKAVWNEWARDFEVALSMFAAHEGCTCGSIMAADPTRHFRGCVLREKYPDHPAAKVVSELNLDVARERNALLEEVQTLRRNMPGPTVMEFLAWFRTSEAIWRDEDEAICAEFFAQRIEAKADYVKKEPRCGIGGCTLHPGHPGDHGSYLMRDGRDMGPVLRPETYAPGFDPGCPVHGVGLRIGPATTDLGGGLRWTTEAECTCGELKSNAWSSAAAAPPGAVPLKPPSGPTVFEHDLEVHRKRIHAIMSSRSESADNWVSDALWFLLAVTHAPGEPALEKRVEKLEGRFRRGPMIGLPSFPTEQPDARERSKNAWRDWDKEEIERELAPWLADKFNALTDAELLKEAVAFLDGVGSDARGSLGPGSVSPDEPTQEAEMLADIFKSIRRQARRTEDALFKSWPVEKQLAYLHALVEEHAYSLGLKGERIDLPKAGGTRVQAAWTNGNDHRIEEERKKSPT